MQAKVVAMTNKAEAALYADDDSIATIEESIVSKQRSSQPLSEVNYNPIITTQPQQLINLVNRDEASVASLVTMELLLSRQSRTNTRIDKIDLIMNQILYLLQSRKVSNPNDKDSSSETGSKASTGRRS